MVTSTAAFPISPLAQTSVQTSQENGLSYSRDNTYREAMLSLLAGDTNLKIERYIGVNIIIHVKMDR